MDTKYKTIDKHIAYNVTAHDCIAESYETKHIEIYNPIEQKRIKSVLEEAISQVKTDSTRLGVLDFGSGTGNLTRHLLELGANVIAGDVSPKSLEVLKKKFNNSDRLETVILNGKNLSNFPDNTFDIVSTYSVLHHVPDYLYIIDEFIRVTKPGGVIYIDHEVCPSYWYGCDFYLDYLKELGDSFLKIYKIELRMTDNPAIENQGKLKKLVSIFYQKMFGIAQHLLLQLGLRQPIMMGEGDLHTSKDDHIEWLDIRSRLHSFCSIISEKDYLVCRETDQRAPVWNKWKNRCVDMQMIIAKKVRI